MASETTQLVSDSPLRCPSIGDDAQKWCRDPLARPQPLVKASIYPYIYSFAATPSRSLGKDSGEKPLLGTGCRHRKQCCILIPLPQRLTNIRIAYSFKVNLKCASFRESAKNKGFSWAKVLRYNFRAQGSPALKLLGC